MILGIDTSCYTTSVAIMNQESRLTCDMKRLLAVEKGARGLRQSDAVYAHTQNLPQLLAELFGQHQAQQLTAIAVSAKPRPEDNSFMPVFTSGYEWPAFCLPPCRYPCWLLATGGTFGSGPMVCRPGLARAVSGIASFWRYGRNFTGGAVS